MSLRSLREELPLIDLSASLRVNLLLSLFLLVLPFILRLSPKANLTTSSFEVKRSWLGYIGTTGCIRKGEARRRWLGTATKCITAARRRRRSKCKASRDWRCRTGSKTTTTSSSYC